MSPPSGTPLSVVIPTKDEAVHIEAALRSLRVLGAEVFVLDSASTDGTRDIARREGATVVDYEFRGYAHMRNWALDNLPFSHEWVLFLDADERLSPELTQELRDVVRLSSPDVAGYYVKRRFFFMGRWIRHGGYYPVWILRLFRHKLARCEERGVNEHFVVQGATRRLREDLIHENLRDIWSWVEKHKRYATLEALELVRGASSASKPAALGGQAGRKRWLRENAWNRLPPFWRPVLYFLYRYVVLGGFLDGRAGLVYHVFQGLWFPMLIDVRTWELRRDAAMPAPLSRGTEAGRRGAP